ncbi:hypothetical protein GGF37_005718, partial [Kickxella alabastrina]
KKHVQSTVGVDEDVDNCVADIDEEIEDDTVTRHQRDDIRRRHAAVDDEEYGRAHADDYYSGSEDDDGAQYSDSSSVGRAGLTRMPRRNTKKTGLTSPEQVLKFVQIMHRSARQTRIIEILVGKLMETNDPRLLKSLIGLQGASILRSWLQDYENDDVMMIKILQCIAHMPISTRNTIEENRLEEAVKPLCSYSDETISGMASDLVKKWATLRHVFKIPKKNRKESAAGAAETLAGVEKTPVGSRRESPNHAANGTPLVSVGQHTMANAAAGAVSGGGGGGDGDSPAGVMRWRSSNNMSQPPSRMRSESPAPRDMRGYSQPSQQHHQHQQQQQQQPYYGNQQQHQQQYAPASATLVATANGWGRRGSMYRGQSPVRAPYNAGYRSRYGQQQQIPSRSRSPGAFHRTGTPYSTSRYPRSSGYNTPGSSYQQQQQQQQQHVRGRYSSWGNQSSYVNNEHADLAYDSGGGRRNAGLENDGGNRADYANHNSPPVAPAAATNSAAGAPKLAPGWRTAYTGDGIAYYYHETTKQTQWEPPVVETAGHSAPVPPAMSNTGAGAAGGNSRRSNLGLPSSADHHTSGSGSQYHYNQAHESRVPSASSVSMPGDRWGASAGAEDAKMSGVPKTRAEEGIDRAQRMGAMQSRTSTI